MNQQPDFLIGNVLREFLENSTTGICVIDINGLIQEANPVFCQFTGYSREELFNRPLADIEDQEDADRLANHRVEILTLGEARFSTTYRCKDGQAIKTEISVSVIGLEGRPFWLIFIGEFNGT